MSNRMTLEEVERLAAQLASPEQLKLAARICDKLSATAIGTRDSETARQQRLAQVDAWLAECDAVAESIEGTFDAAEDIRRIREERASHS